jgi:diaminohydroxyphosphoribosylaminopyrimidine deaminase/5-amino-6-(5-phosphoribosylamino)uracil reductase
VPAIVASGIRRVVVGMGDPNPCVGGRGIAALRRAGVAVVVGCRRREAERLNEAYVHRMRTGFPFVISKAAMTLDGKIATASGESRWITGRASRLDAHRLRSEVDAILVGIGTVLKDDPRLTVRLPGVKSRQPLRVILDSRLRLPLSARILSAGRGRGVVVVTTAKAPPTRMVALQRRGISVLVLPAAAGRVPMRRALQALAAVGVNSLLIEGGAEVNASAWRGGLVNRLVWYVAPHVLGGRNAPSVIGGPALNRLAEKIVLTEVQVRRVGSDLRLDARVQSQLG